MSARSNSEASSNDSSPPSSVHMPGNNQVTNIINNNNAPKYGTLVPNRIFVGGIPSNTTEPELCQLFSKYGNVKATKIIADRAGVSKGYGFVTFETEEEAKRLQSDADNIVLRERRLNIAPAVKKQPFSRVFESTTSPPPATPSLYYHNGIPYTFHNGMAYFPQTPNQGAPTVPTPELPAVFQGSGFGPQGNAQSFGPAMMYPCGANPAAAMFITPQPYNPYPHLPVQTQGPPPLMYTGGPTPAVSQATNTAAENTQTVQMSAGPPAQFYLPPTMAAQAPEIYYNMQPTPSQGCYGPLVTLAPHDMHYCEVPLEQGSNNITPEGTNAMPTPERPMSNASAPADTNNCSEPNGRHPAFHRRIENSETPVVSLLSLQDDDNGMNSRPNKFNGAGKPPLRNINNGARPPPPPPQSGYPFNGIVHPSKPKLAMAQQDTMQRVDRDGGYRPSSVGMIVRGSGRGRGAKYLVTNYASASHDTNNNNNNSYVEKPENGQYLATRGMRGMTRGRGRGRGGGSGGTSSITFTRGGRKGSLPTSFPPPSISPSLSFTNSPRPPRYMNPNHHINHHHHLFNPNPTLKSGSHFQMQQQLFHQRNFANHFYPHYTPHVHQQPPPPPPPPLPQPQQSRRYGNGKKPTNGSSATHMNTVRKLKTVEGMDSGAAGDGPVPNIMQVSLTPPPTPVSSNKTAATATATTQDLCAHVQAMSL